MKSQTDKWMDQLLIMANLFCKRSRADLQVKYTLYAAYSLWNQHNLAALTTFNIFRSQSIARTVSVIIILDMQPPATICQYGFFCKSLVSMIILICIVIILAVFNSPAICQNFSYNYYSDYTPCDIVFILVMILASVALLNIGIVIVASCVWTHREQIIDYNLNRYNQNRPNLYSNNQFNPSHSQNNIGNQLNNVFPGNPIHE